MSHANESGGSPQQRLWAALSAESELTCEQAEELLPLLVQAEAEGEEVASDSRFAALFRHLDICEDCALLYAQLSQDLAAVIAGSSEPLVVTPAARPFFVPKRPPTKEYKSPAWVLQVWNDMIRSLELVTQPLTLTPKRDVLGVNEHNRALFSDRVPDLKDKPIFSVTLQRQNEQTLVRVVLRDIRTATTWQVRLAAGGQVWEQQTDERGVADFTEVRPDSIAGGMTITCREIVA